MTNELVRVRLPGGEEDNLGRSHAERLGLEVLDESPWDGAQPRPRTRRNGRKRKTRTSVDQKVAEKQGAVEKSAPTTKE